ncbi:MAG TPA: tetratricopeptide repeat protein [Terriglobales bacterium]
MWGLYSFLFPWNFVLQGIAIVHFIRRRPDTYWLYIILIGGSLGALAYIAVEVLPDMGLLRESVKVFPRRRRIHELEAIVIDNPSAGNYEELADLYLDEKKFSRARDCYNKSISTRTDSPDPFYRRGIAELELKDFTSAVPDLERVVTKDATYDFHRAAGLLAHAYAKTGQPEKADSLFRQALQISTLSETYLNYADFLASQGRTAEAREWTKKVLAKKPTLPRYLKRRDRPWFRRAKGLLRQLPAS